jgi:uncharacterized protein GlcG (DUF336 family)
VLTLAAAQKIVAAAQAEAERNHLAGVIAVVDDGGWPILLLRMDNAAYVASVELAPRQRNFRSPILGALGRELEGAVSRDGNQEAAGERCQS